MAGPLYYSPNEVRGGLPLLLPKAESLSTLPVDYGWLAGDDLILVEHKAAGDLAQSLRNGRLAAQLETAKAETPFVYLAVTGFMMPYDAPGDNWELVTLTKSTAERWTPEPIRSQWDYRRFVEALYALLHGLQVGGPLVGCCKRATAINLVALKAQTCREALGRGRPILAKWRHTHAFDVVESYARGLRLGWRHAEALAKWAPSWVILCHRLVKEGPKGVAGHVEGFGTVLAQRLYDRVIGKYRLNG